MFGMSMKKMMGGKCGGKKHYGGGKYPKVMKHMTKGGMKRKMSKGGMKRKSMKKVKSKSAKARRNTKKMRRY